MDDFIRELSVTSLPGTRRPSPFLSTEKEFNQLMNPWFWRKPCAELTHFSRRGTRHGEEVVGHGREDVRGPPARGPVPAAEGVRTAHGPDPIPLLPGAGRAAGALREGAEVGVGGDELQHPLHRGASALNCFFKV